MNVYNTIQQNDGRTKPRINDAGVSYGKIGLTTVAVAQYLLSGMQLVLVLIEKLIRR